MKIPRCKITVLKRTFDQDLVDTYLEEGFGPQGPCECFKEGQEFIELTACMHVTNCHIAVASLRYACMHGIHLDHDNALAKLNSREPPQIIILSSDYQYFPWMELEYEKATL